MAENEGVYIVKQGQFLAESGRTRYSANVCLAKQYATYKQVKTPAVD